MLVLISNGQGKVVELLLDQCIAYWQALLLVLPCPNGKCLFDIGKLAFWFACWRTIAFILIEILLLVTQDLGDRTA